MQEKAKVDADIYVEDSPKNVELLRAENVPTIVFSNSTNEHLPDPRANTWAQVVDLVLAHKEKWERGIRSAA